MRKKEIEKIKEISLENGVKYTYLFGSVAKGKATKRSDIDFAVKFKKTKNDPFKLRLKMMSDLSEALKRDDIEVVDVDKVGPLMHFNIIKDGKMVYSSSEKDRIMDKARAMKIYHDRRYYLDRHYQKKLDKLAK